MAPETRLSAAQQRRYTDRVWESLHEVPEPARIAAVAYASGLMGRGLPVVFDARHLAVVTGVASQTIGAIRKRNSAFYSRFLIAKKGGGSRELAAPVPSLRAVQDWIQIYILPKLQIHAACHGFVQGRSIITNATPHVGAAKLLKLDIKDFFGSVGRRPVYRAFRRLGYTKDVSDLFTTLVTLDSKLPQGAPTSPALANDAAFRLDLRLQAFSERVGLRYTRYADDLTFSGPRVSGARVRRTIERIMRDEGFAPNDKKLRYVHAYEQQRVTGIVVNEKPNWPRERRRWLRQEIYFLAKHGVGSHEERRGVSRSRYKEFIYGHVYALHMVRPEEARSYLAVLDEIPWAY